MTTLKAHYDGKVLVPDEPVDLPVNCSLEVQIKLLEGAEQNPLLELARRLDELPSSGAWPEDGAAQHDHYLYGVPQKP